MFDTSSMSCDSHISTYVCVGLSHLLLGMSVVFLLSLTVIIIVCALIREGSMDVGYTRLCVWNISLWNISTSMLKPSFIMLIVAARKSVRHSP